MIFLGSLIFYSVFEVIPEELDRDILFKSQLGRKGLSISLLSSQLSTVGQGMKEHEEPLLATSIPYSWGLSIYSSRGLQQTWEIREQHREQPYFPQELESGPHSTQRLQTLPDCSRGCIYSVIQRVTSHCHPACDHSVSVVNGFTDGLAFLFFLQATAAHREVSVNLSEWSGTEELLQHFG